MSFKLSSDKFNDINKMIVNFKENDKLELETRFFGKNFIEANLDICKYKKTLDYFIYSKENGGFGMKYDVISELVIYDEYDKNKRLIITGLDNIKKYWLNGNLENLDYTFMRKENLEKVDINEYSMRFSLSNEEELDKENETLEYLKNSNKNSIKMYRFKNRYQVYSDNGIVKIDFSSVKQSDKSYNSFKNSNTLKNNINYEIEVELIHNENTKKMTSDEIFKEYMKINYLVLSLIQNNKNIMNISETNEIIKNYNKLVGIDKPVFITANPVTLHIENIDKKRRENMQNIYNKYAVTYKADGERRLLFIDGSGICYILDINFNVYNVGITMKEWGNTLIECEYINDLKLLLMYDILFSKGKDIRRLHLKIPPSKRSKNNYGRLDTLDYFLIDYKNIDTSNAYIKLDNKKYLFSTLNDGSDIFEKANELWKNKSNIIYNIDGLIFVPITEYYPLQAGSWYSLFKWKPPELNTIDFLIETIKDKYGKDVINPYLVNQKNPDGSVEKILKKYKTVQLYVGGKIKEVGKNNKIRYSYGKILFNPVDSDDNNNNNETMYNRCNIFINSENKMLISDNINEIKDNMIVEFGYDPSKEEKFRWIPYKIRYDKTQSYNNGMKVYGNNENIANDIFRSLRIPVTEENIITGQIDDSVLSMASKIKAKNINNQHENSYYKNTNLEKFDPNNRSSFQNFHNIWVKENLYKKVSPAFNNKSNKLMGRLLDLGSGKGGDIGKWKRAKYEYVLGIEYDIKNIEYAKNLFSKIPQPKPKTYFVRGDLSKLIFPNYDAGLTESNKVNLNTFLPSQNTFNVVSIQFALHYFFKDEITLRTLLQNVTDNLEVNGYFIGTCFDGKRVFNKLKGKKKIDGKTDGNLLWSIEKKYVAKTLPNTKTTFGKEIDVFVKSIGNNHIEYLVNFDYLDSIMKEYGFNKIEVKSFSDYFDEMKNNGNNGNNMKKIANEMTDVEKELSFLNNAFIYQKVENTPDSIRTNLIKLMKKQETKNYLNKNGEEIKETVNKLKVEEVKSSTENLIEDEEENNMNTDMESDLEIQIDKKPKD